jgi:hypothetical protein
MTDTDTVSRVECPWCAGYRPIAGTGCICDVACGSDRCEGDGDADAEFDLGDLVGAGRPVVVSAAEIDSLGALVRILNAHRISVPVIDELIAWRNAAVDPANREIARLREQNALLRVDVELATPDHDALADECEQLHAFIDGLGGPEVEHRVVAANGGLTFTPSEKDLREKDEWIDGWNHEVRDAYYGDWRPFDAAGGAFTLPPRAEIERQATPDRAPVHTKWADTKAARLDKAKPTGAREDCR